MAVAAALAVDAEDLFIASPRSERRSEMASGISPRPEAKSQQGIFDFILDECLSVTRAEPKPLSLTKRAMIQVVHQSSGPSSHQRFIVRISVHNNPTPGTGEVPLWESKNSSQRILRFWNYWMEHRDEVIGLVPALAAPQIVETSHGQLMVEQYQEIVFDRAENTRKDLLGMCTMGITDLTRPLGYVYDVAVTLAGLHEHGWCHMDVSLENVALAAHQAYLIDFESALPFSEHHMIRRSSVKVPLKLPFVPPEHFCAKRSDYVSLRAYDVWGWGLLLFECIFQCYLFDLVDPGNENSYTGCTYSPDMNQVQLFVKVGFKKFLKKTHRPIYDELYSRGRKKAWIGHAKDLMERVFVLAVERRDRSAGRTEWLDHKRYTCEQIVKHPLWDVIGCRRRRRTATV